MAIKWSSVEGHVKVGIDLSVSGTKITIKYYAGTDYSGGVSDGQTLTAWGDLDFTDSFHNDSTSSSPKLITTRTKTGSRGKTYSFGAKLSGVYSGGTPSVTDSIKVPATVPSKMSKPSISNIKSSSATMSWSKPSGNGDAVIGAWIQVDNHSNFSSPTESYRDTASPSYPNGLAANTVYYARARAYNSVGDGAWSDTVSFRTKVLSPTAPTIGTPTRNSDTSITVRWTRNVSTARPYDSQQVYRRYYTGSGWSSWTRIASVSATATSYNWQSANQGHVYQFLVKALNDAGSANSSDSGNVYTTPDAPTSVKATKNAAGNIVLTWAMGDDSGTVGSSVGFDIQESAGGGTWTTLVSGVEAKTWTHSAPNPSVTHAYRVRTRIIASGLPGSGLASGYVSSNTVQLLAPPNAPTNLEYTPGGVVDRTLPVVLSWVHNPVDSSDQTKFQVRHRAVGDTTWTTETVVNSDLSTWTLPANTYLEATQVEWQVMTWGLHATGSPWSASNTIQLSTKPELVLDFPTEGEVLTTATLEPMWTFADSEAEEQVGWEITLTDLTNNNVLETRVGADAAGSAVFRTKLQDGGSYQVDVRVKDQSGLWSLPQSATVTVEYALPPAPQITDVVWDALTASVDVQFATPAPEADQVPVDHFEVWRRIDEGEWALLTQDLPSDAINYVDYTPTVSGRNTYLVVAVSDIPSESQSSLTFVSRTNLATNPSFEAPATDVATPVVRQNLVPNPSFEASTTGWGVTQGTLTPTSAFQQMGGRVGSYVAQATANGLSTTMYPWTEFPITPADGEAFAYRLWYAHDTADNPRVRQVVYFYDAANALIEQQSAPWQTGAGFYAGRWVTLSGIIPANAAKMRIYLTMSSADGVALIPEGRRMWLDQVRVEQAPTVAQAEALVQTYYDASLPPVELDWLDAYWTGAEHDSTTVLVPKGAAYPTVSGVARMDGAGGMGSGGSSSFCQAENAPGTLGKSLAIVPKAGQSSAYVYTDAVGGTGVSGILQPGRTYRVSVDVTIPAPLSAGVAMIQVDPGSGSAMDFQALNEPGTQRISATFTVSGTSTDSRWVRLVGCSNPAGAPYDITFWDNYLIEDVTDGVPADDSYFDGNTEAHDDITYSYLGAEGDSPSVELSPLETTYVLTPEKGDTEAVFLNAYTAPEFAARLFHNVEFSVSTALERVLNRFAGRVLPVESTGIAEDTSWQVTGVLRPYYARELDPEGMELIWEQVARTRGPHLLRSPAPELHTWVSLSGFNIARSQGGVEYTVSFTATKVSAP